MQFLTIIPARGGSKGVYKKNIKSLNGKPLIQYTIEAAKDIFKEENICVSTDSKEIKAIVEEIGLNVPFLRPDILATDKAGTYEVLLHAIDYYENQGMKFDAVVLLQPTSPLRESNQIREAIKIFSLDIYMVVSVKETNSNPYYVLFEEDESGLLKKSKEGDYVRRQDCPKVWEYNGAIYIINVDSLKKEPIHKFSKIIKYEMDEKSSFDIDSDLDFKLVELILKQS